MSIDKKIKKTRQNKQKEIWELIEDNFWVEYFINTEAQLKDGWTGFEGEMSLVIQRLDNIVRIRKGHPLRKTVTKEEIDKMPELIRNNSYLLGTNLVAGKNYYFVEGKTEYKEFRDKIVRDLSRLIRLLELYFIIYARRTQSKTTAFPKLKTMGFTRILSFNYTDTYSKIYSGNTSTQISYIHGNIDANHAKQSVDSIVKYVS